MSNMYRDWSTQWFVLTDTVLETKSYIQSEILHNLKLKIQSEDVEIKSQYWSCIGGQSQYA